MMHSAAHNMIVINGESYIPAAEGILIGFQDSPVIPVVAIAGDPAAPFYKGVAQVRCAALLGTSEYIVFDRVICDEPVTIDRYQWGKGIAQMSTELKPFDTIDFIPDPKNSFFSEIKGGPAGKALDILFGNGLKMHLMSDVPFEPFRAMSHGGYESVPMEVTFARRTQAKGVNHFLATFSYGADISPAAGAILKSTDEEIQFSIKSEKEGMYLITIDLKNKNVSAVKLPNIRE